MLFVVDMLAVLEIGCASNERPIARIKKYNIVNILLYPYVNILLYPYNSYIGTNMELVQVYHIHQEGNKISF